MLLGEEDGHHCLVLSGVVCEVQLDLFECVVHGMVPDKNWNWNRDITKDHQTLISSKLYFVNTNAIESHNLTITWLVIPTSSLAWLGMLRVAGVTVVFVKAACGGCALCLTSCEMIMVTPWVFQCACSLENLECQISTEFT